MISGQTKITGIFGFPIAHTLSPAMHNAAFNALKLDFVYLPFEVQPRDLSKTVEAIRCLGLRGVNVTIPHKKNVMRFLDKIDPLARRIGSVNTIVNKNGFLTGYNTDGSGFLKDIIEKGFNPKGKTALLLGAGGAGYALAAILSINGAKKIYITDYQTSRATELSKRTPRSHVIPLDTWKENIPDSDILINATPAGMHSGDPLIVKSSELGKNIFVYDLIYHRRTELLHAAAKAGLAHSNGLGMLLNQGSLAFELWTEKRAPTEVMRRALLKALKNK